MSSLSPQRNRKPQGHQGSTQNMPPREMSPSPPFRDRQRSIKTQSMPLVPSVMQMYANSNQSRQGLQPSPTISNGSHQSRRSPPPAPTTQITPSTIKLPTLNTRNVNTESLTPSPPPIHSHNQSNIHPTFSSSAQPQHSHSLPNIHSHNPQIGNPRPINRMLPPQFLAASFRPMDENWAMTDELMAEFERADKQQQATGTGGVAYAGGAASAGVSYSRKEAESPPKDQEMERMRSGEKTSPNDVDGGAPGRRQGRPDREREQLGSRESPKTRDRQPPPQQIANAFAHNHPQSHSPERRASPSYHSPLGSPGEHPGTSYTQYKREPYRMPTPPILRRPSNAPIPDSNNTTAAKRATPPAASKLSSQTPPLQAIKTRSPDRSLPVREEPEDDVAVSAKNGSRDRVREYMEEMTDRSGSPTPSSDLHPEGHTSRFEDHGGRESRVGHREDDDETLIEQVTGDRRTHDSSRETEEEGYTPRSPSTTLPDDNRDRLYGQNADGRQPVRVRNRMGATDQLGLRGFETAVYEQSGNPKAVTPVTAMPYRVNDDYSRRHPQSNHSEPNNALPLMPLDDFQSFLDDPTSAYLHAYFQSPRPNAPVPPTPHSQTAAPSPSPLVSGMQSVPPYSPIPPVGSPYPFPFSHVRRTHAYANPTNRFAPSTTYDPNHPSVIHEQLALQMQMYAQNNNRAPASDSTFSPSSTPFQGAGYNPWAFLHMNRAFGGRQADPMMSMQSSPSHEPLPLPLPPIGRGVKKRERSMNLRSQAVGGQPPPRVESTQPRETSPEPCSSGDETAGDERYLAEPEEGNWVNGIVHDDSGDWVDEDAEGDDDDLLELEYHPSFVSNVEKRRRRWETRWESMIEAFHALDRQTDATLVLFASPSHSSKLHSLTSRSVRRDASLAKSPALSNMRSAFRSVAAKRRSARTQKSSLADRLMVTSGGSADGSETSGEPREEELKRMLGAALGSLTALGGIYEQREVRWREEMRRVSEDRERVELLLQQALGVGLTNGTMVGRAL